MISFQSQVTIPLATYWFALATAPTAASVSLYFDWVLLYCCLYKHITTVPGNLGSLNSVCKLSSTQLEEIWRKSKICKIFKAKQTYSRLILGKAQRTHKGMYKEAATSCCCFNWFVQNMKYSQRALTDRMVYVCHHYIMHFLLMFYLGLKSKMHFIKIKY